jgi:hypothetical protein
MEFIGEIFWQIIILGTLALAVSFVVWKLKGSKMDFGDFLNKYGELLAYAGLLFIALIIIIFQATK